MLYYNKKIRIPEKRTCQIYEIIQNLQKAGKNAEWLPWVRINEVEQCSGVLLQVVAVRMTSADKYLRRCHRN